MLMFTLFSFCRRQSLHIAAYMLVYNGYNCGKLVIYIKDFGDISGHEQYSIL
jgi:hypothetical protein